MKFVVIASTFVALATLGDATISLRGGSKKSDHSALESRVTMKGVVGEPSAEDLNLLGKALVASYNDVHWELGHYLLSGYEITASLDDSKKNKSQLSVSIVTPFKKSDDESNSLSVAGGEDDSAMGVDHASLEAAFCNRIKSSESKFWMGANACSIVFDTSESKVTVVDKSSSRAVMESHVILHGVLEGASKEDAEIIGKALVSSFNALNWESQYSMSEVHIPFHVAIPDSAASFLQRNDDACSLCRDDDAAAAEQKALYLTVVTPLKQDDSAASFLQRNDDACSLCRDDDAAKDDSAALYARRELEVLFCEKIKSSVSMNLKSANKCSIVMVAENN
jgi:hypothetical protein